MGFSHSARSVLGVGAEGRQKFVNVIFLHTPSVWVVYYLLK